MFKLKFLDLTKEIAVLSELPKRKLLINTINAHSYNVAQKDSLFAEALKNGDVLLPDGISIVYAYKWLLRKKIKRIAGADLFHFAMTDLNKNGGICFFLGSNDYVLKAITERAKIDYPNIKLYTYAPFYKKEFSKEENQEMIDAVNQITPDILWIGMTAPKQEKWAYIHLDELKVKGWIGCIGAVFDFYAGTKRRAPKWMISLGLEWLHRLLTDPKRMWKRYLIGNILFLYNIFKERFTTSCNVLENYHT